MKRRWSLNLTVYTMAFGIRGLASWVQPSDRKELRRSRSSEHQASST